MSYDSCFREAVGAVVPYFRFTVGDEHFLVPKKTTFCAQNFTPSTFLCPIKGVLLEILLGNGVGDIYSI